MGTTWSARLTGSAGLDLAPIHAALTAILDAVIAEMSPWEPASAISRFNRLPAGRWQSLPPAFFHVLQTGLAIARESDGAFDPTAGALVDLWGFGPLPAAILPPAPDSIATARAAAGWEKLALDIHARRARQPGGLRLDLSGIAKGYAVDRLILRLAELGHPHALVEIGGELHGAGVKPDGQPWWVTVEPPPGPPLPELRVALHGLAIATSGDYRRHFDHAGTRYAHSIDPRTGAPVRNDVAAVTVLHPECMRADALATALLVMGLEAGLTHATRHAIPALFVTRKDGRLTEHPSPGLTALLT